MTLEIKHLAPYLPYELKAQDLRTKEIRLVTLLHFTYNRESVGHNHLIYEGLLLNRHIPILRPISDLCKNEFPFEIGTYTPDFKFVLENTEYHYISKMIELHFDVFGLIEKGMAISIHDIG